MPGPAVDGDRLAALAAAARGGDVDAFEQLVVATSPQVHALVLRLVRDEHDAGDVVQETYLRAFRSIGAFRGQAAVTTWLYRIAANCASSHLSRRRSHDVLAADLPLADLRAERDQEAAATGVDDRGRLLAALDALPATMRSVVVLHDVYDLPHEAIAAELGISRAASKVRLHRARRRLRDALFAKADTERSASRGTPATVAAMPEVTARPVATLGQSARGTGRKRAV